MDNEHSPEAEKYNRDMARFRDPQAWSAAAIAPGNNPDRLTNEQVGDGYRLLTREEIEARFEARCGESLLVERWFVDTWDDTGWPGWDPGSVYRVPVAKGSFMPVVAPIDWQARAEEAEQKHDRLRMKLYEVGICPNCFEERKHSITEPFSDCSCGTAEDAGEPPLIQVLRAELTDCHNVVLSTRQAAADAMDNVRLALGAPLSKDDTGSNRAVDHAAELRAEVEKYKKLYEEEETMRRNANRNNADLRAEVERLTKALELERQWVASLTKDNGTLIQAADSTKAGALAVSQAGQIEHLLSQLAAAREDKERTISLLESAAAHLAYADSGERADFRSCYYRLRAAIDAERKEAKS